jgi:putative ABC transport system ATP-binding protein
VRCADVSRTFRRGGVEVAAVRKVDCTVTAGMRIALTGPSGSGKSTLLHLLAGLDRPSAGTVSWPGLDGAPRERPGVVGVVFQGPSLIPALDVQENVALPLLLAGVREGEAVERANAALDGLALSGLVAALPEELSGGQAQRVAIARVLAGRPALVLADEPTGQLDRATATQVMTELLRAADALDAAVVVATHDPEVAGRLSRQWRMDDGALLAPEEGPCPQPA